MVLLATWFQWVTALGPVTVTLTGATGGEIFADGAAATSASRNDADDGGQHAGEHDASSSCCSWSGPPRVARHATPPANDRVAGLNNHDQTPMNGREFAEKTTPEGPRGGENEGENPAVAP